MLLLSAIKKTALAPKTYFEQEKNNTNPLRAFLNFAIAVFCLLLPFVPSYIATLTPAPITAVSNSCAYSQIPETNSALYSLGGHFAWIGFWLLLFCVITFGLAKLFGGKANFVQHLNSYGLALRNSVLPIESVILSIFLLLQFIFFLGLPAMLAVALILSFASTGVLFLGFAYVIKTILSSTEYTHELDFAKSVATVGVPLALMGFLVLGMLLTLLNGLSISQVNSPADLMKTDLKNIVSSGYGVMQPKAVNFFLGTLKRECAIGDSPVEPRELSFYCGTPDLCLGPGAPLEVDPGKISVSQNVRAYVVVCGDGGRKTDPLYCIGIGRLAQQAREACVTHCLK